MSGEELKPCAHCGGKPDMYRAGATDWHVYCEICDVQTARMGSENAAVAVWNKRAHPLPEQPQEGEDKLPCDIKLPPATLIRAGCSFETLRVALSNPNRPKHFPETAAERQARAVMMPQSGSVTAPSGGQSYGMLSGCMDLTEPSPPSTETKESGE